MMGVTLSTPSYIYGDSMVVVHSTQRPVSNFEEEFAVSFAVHESVAMGESLTGHILMAPNPADIATS